MTAISFYTPLKAIASVGVSAGDIVAIAGAGRLAGNWIKAKYFDQSLRELVNAEDILHRKGLVDPFELNRRWSREMILFGNGRILPLQHQDVRIILEKVDYDHFTWFMTLVTASLTVATSESCKCWIITHVLSYCIEHEAGKAYLSHDLTRNIESWNSIATTRKIVEVGRVYWTRLAYGKVHQPGMIPDAEKHELRRFFLWLFGAQSAQPQSREFRTASSDVVALAMLLNHLGLTVLLTNCDPSEVLESQIVVIWDTNSVGHIPAVPMAKRRGMPINLTNPEEVISLWPGNSMQNNRRREIFKSAFDAVGDIHILPGQLITGQLSSRADFQPLFALKYNKPQRLSGPVVKFTDAFIVAPSASVGVALQDVITSWGLSEDLCRTIVTSVSRLNPEPDYAEQVAQLQIFTLGYYYGLLCPIVDTSRMSLQEAFASWTWNDLELFQLLLSGTKLHGDQDVADANGGGPAHIVFHERSLFLKISAYLFAGAEMGQIRVIRRACCGVKGKLVLVDSVLLGDADDVDKICQFTLLDIDGTCLPGNVQGVLLSGEHQALSPVFLPEKDPENIDQINLPSGVPDFTSLIEPNWDFDLNECLVAYRHYGRIKHRVSSEAIFNAVFGASRVSDIYYGNEGQFRYAVGPPETYTTGDNTSRLAVRLSLEDFNEGSLPVPMLGLNPEHQFCIAPNSLPKFRACMATVYNMDTIETLHLANLRQPAAGPGGTALVVNLEWGQVIIK